MLLTAGVDAYQYSHYGHLCGSFINIYFYYKFYYATPGHILQRFNILLQGDLP